MPSLAALAARRAVASGATPDQLLDGGYPPAVVASVASAVEEQRARPLTVEAVHTLLVARCGGASLRQAEERVNPCLKRALLLGRVTLPPPSPTTEVCLAPGEDQGGGKTKKKNGADKRALDNVLLEAGCVHCGSRLVCRPG